MKLIVQLDSGELFDTKAKSSDSLSAAMKFDAKNLRLRSTQVKQAVFEQTNVPPERQRLYFGGTELLDGETLAHSLWTALRKISAVDASEDRLDLRTVKAMCSPATSPNRGLSPVRSASNLLTLVEHHEEESNTATLDAAAAKLAGMNEKERGVSPQRRMAANRIAEQYSRSFDEGDAASPIAAVAQATHRTGREPGSPLSATKPAAVADEGARNPAVDGEGFHGGYHDDMIL